MLSNVPHAGVSGPPVPARRPRVTPAAPDGLRCNQCRAYLYLHTYIDVDDCAGKSHYRHQTAEMLEYKHLSEDERNHFVEHGWLKVENAIDPKYMEAWLADFWVRLGWDKNDKSTWKEEYIKQPRHREVPAAELCPEAWAKMCEIVGGEDKVDPIRERYFGDQWISNFGSEERTKEGGPIDHKTLSGWHTDNDWYRHFLDSSGNALTIILCFTDVLPEGGGTALCEDGIKRICEILYEHPEGLDPPYTNQILYQHCKESSKFTQIEAKAGDIFITHGLLPHAHTPNRKWYPRIITNPHVNMSEPWNLNREDGDYTLCEKVILRALDRESIPEYIPTRPRTAFYPRTAWFKRERVTEELKRMIADAEARGGSVKDVDSVYLRGEEAILEHERRNGYDKEFGESGVSTTMSSGSAPYHPTTKRQILV